MTPGLPGTGISGLFYILGALWMPVCELWRRRRGNPARAWAVVARQFAIAVGVIAAMVGVFWALDHAILSSETARLAAVNVHAIRAMRVSTFLITASVLAVLLGTVHLARLVLWLRRVQSGR